MLWTCPVAGPTLTRPLATLRYFDSGPRLRGGDGRRHMTAKLFIHGVPDSPAIWRPLLTKLDLGDTPVAVPALPGFTAPLPPGFAATKEAYADWAVGEVETLVAAHGPIDIVGHDWGALIARSEEHTSELQSLMRTSYAVFCL